MSARPSTSLAARFSSKRSLTKGSGNRDADKPAFALGGEFQAASDIFTSQLREIRNDLRLRHARRQIGKHIAHGKARAAHARLTEAHLRINDYAITVFHVRQIAGAIGK